MMTGRVLVGCGLRTSGILGGEIICRGHIFILRSFAGIIYKFEIFVSSILLLLCTCYSNSPSRAFCYRSKLPVLATKILCPSLCFRIFGFDLPGIRGSVYNLFSTSLTTCLYWNLICTRLKFRAFVINVVWQKTRIDRTSMTPQHHRPRRCFTDCSALCRWPKSFLLHVKGQFSGWEDQWRRQRWTGIRHVRDPIVHMCTTCTCSTGYNAGFTRHLCKKSLLICLFRVCLSKSGTNYLMPSQI